MTKSGLMQSLNEKSEREAINDYEFTCQTIIAMENVIGFNLGGKLSQGTKLRTSSANTITANTDITPDIVIEVQRNGKSEDYRALNEVKVNIPANEEYWLDYARQMKKYDDDLFGWKGKCVDPHDLMFTTNPARTFAFNNYVNKLISGGQIAFSRALSILHSAPMEQTNSFIFIRKDYGKITNPVLDAKLSNGLPINREYIVNEMNKMKFYDAKPPLIYTMMIIWDHVLKTFLTLDQIRQLRGNRSIPVVATVQEIRNRLSKFAPETNPNCIKKSWVEDALNGFVELKLAKMVDKAAEKYEIKLRSHRDETVDWFFKLIHHPEEDDGALNKSLDEFLS